MKKLLLLFSLLTSLFAANAQSGTDCSNAIPFATPFSTHDSVVMGEGKYYSFIAQSEKVKIDLEILNSQYKNYFKLYLFGGSCVGNSLTVIDNLKIEPFHDTLISLNDSNLIIGNTYYVYVGRGWWAGGDTTTSYKLNVNVVNDPGGINPNDTAVYEMGKIYFKIKNSSMLEVLEFHAGESYSDTLFSDLITKYSITDIFKPFPRLYSEELQKTFQINFLKKDSIMQLIADLQASEDIEYAEKIPIERIFTAPSDPLFGSQWSLTQINALGAWNIHPNAATYSNNNIIIAVVDNAILTTHEDLAANLWVNSNEIPGDGIDNPPGNGYIDDINGWDAGDNDGDPNPPNSTFDHGTHVSGIAAAVTNNNPIQLGISSLSWNVRLMPIKATSDATDPATLTNPWAGVSYAIENKANVINMSWGGFGSSITCQNIINLGTSQGIVFVAAVGNLNLNLATTPVYPAMYSNVISVGSTGTSTNYDEKSGFSNYGVGVDVMAPGWNILSSVPTSTSSYGTMDGTSMASPLVASLCGLMKSYNPFLTVAEITNCITSTCDNISAIGSNGTFPGQLGAGRINAQAALQCLLTTPNVAFSSSGTATCPGQTITFFDNSTGGTATAWNWTFPGGAGISNVQNPVIIYNTPGIYSVTLTVTNAFGINTLTQNNYIVVSGSCSITNVSQGNWYFGNRAGVLFATGLPVADNAAVLNNTINSTEAVVSISDPVTGNLLFYSDAVNVWDTNHNLITGALTGSNSRSQILAVPNPANVNQYFLFNSPASFGATSPDFTYSIVDITGGVVTVPLATMNVIVPLPWGANSISEHITAVPHCNGRDYWVIVHGFSRINSVLPENSQFYVYLLSPNGLTNRIMSAGTPDVIPFTFRARLGQLKASPDGTRLAIATWGGSRGVALYDFNNSSGIISNQQILTPVATDYYGCSFDPSSSFLYATPFTSNTIFAWDLANLVAGSSILTTTSGAGASLQLGPNGIIYAARSGTGFLGAINPPYITASYINNAVNLKSCVSCLPVLSLTGLPNFIEVPKPPLTNPAFTFNINADCSTVDFSSICYGNYIATWDFGDVSTAAIGQNVTHTYAAPGTYTVTLTLSNDMESFVVNQNITIIDPASALVINGPNPICFDNTSPVDYFINSINGATYNWTVTNGTIVSPDPTNSNLISVNWTAPGIGAISISVTVGACTSVTTTINIIVNLPTIPIIGSNSPVCIGSTINLTTPTVTGATYNWFGPNSFNSTLQNPSITGATAAMAGTYSVTITVGGCTSLPGTAVITITAMPFANFSYTGSPYCMTAGNPSPTFIFGGTAGIFTSTTGLSINSTNGAINLSLSTPGSYTVTNSIPASGGCAAVNYSTTVTINPTPFITASASPTTVVAGNPVTLTTNATGAIWTPGGAGSTITVNPTTTTTYTVNGNDPITGCPGTATVTVNVIATCPATNTLAANYNASTTLSGTTGFWAASVANTTITGGATLTLSGIQLRMSQNFKITVTSGCTLKITNSTKIWSCTDYMWTGIEVQAGGRVEINTDSRIEDAIIAVHIMNTATTEAQFDIHQCAFNKNYKSIVVDPYPNMHSGIVYSTLFTSAASTLPQLGILGGLTTLKNPYVSSIARRANMGVEIRNVKAIIIGSTLGQNIFNNLEVGIHSFQNTTLYSKNNKFQNITYAKTCPWTMPSCFLQSTTGMGIWAEELGTIVVGGSPSEVNIFVKSNNGIVAKKDINVYASFNTFQQMSSPSLTQSRCIYVEKETGGQVVLINDNTFKDFKDGVFVNFYGKSQVDILHNDFKKFNYQPVNLGPYTVYAGSIAIHCVQNTNSKLNILTNSFNNSAADNGYNAIRVENVIPFNNDAITISTNDISNCTIGIKNANVIKAQVLQNSVRFTITSPPSATCFGIWNNNCQWGSINNNRVYKVGTTAGSNFNNLLYGYATDAGCNFSSVVDNKAQNLNTGYRFAGSANLPNTYTCNFIQSNYTGLELNTTNIGNQGAAGTIAEDNQWTLTTLPLSFGAYNTASTIPTFYTRGSSTPWGLLLYQQSPSTGTGAVNFSVTTAINYNCSYGCPNYPCSHAPIARIAKKMAPYDMLSVDNTDITYFNTYYLLKSDSTIYQSGTPDDVIIINFKDSLALTNTGAFYEVSDKMALADTVQAKIKNDAIVPKNCKEQSLQIVNKIYLSTWANGKFEFSAFDSLSLFTIANYSVEDCGIAVYIARVMMRIDKNDYPRLQSRMAMQESEIIDDGFGLMYPNPAQNEAYYKTTLEETEKGYIELININGQVVSKTILVSGENTVKINLTELSNGLYLYRIIINGEQRTSNKLIIQK